MIVALLYSRILVSLALASLTSTVILTCKLLYPTYSPIPTTNHVATQELPPAHVVFVSGPENMFSRHGLEASISSIKEYSTGPMQYYYYAGSMDEQQQFIMKPGTEQVKLLNLPSPEDTHSNIDEYWINELISTLPDTIDKVLIIDIDTIFYCDIYSLIRNTFSGKNDKQQQHQNKSAIASVPLFSQDGSSSTASKHVIPGLTRKGAKALNDGKKIREMQMTFQDGLYIINVEQWKQRDISKRIRNITNWDRKEQLYDETFASTAPLRMAIQEDFQPLPTPWNVDTKKLKGAKRLTDEVRSNICMLHYSHPKKPWDGQGKLIDEWQCFASNNDDAIRGDGPKASNLFICRHFKPLCDRTPGKLKAAKEAGIEMHYRIWGIGGFWTAMFGFVCFLVGLFISTAVDVDNHHEDNKGSKDEDVLPLIDSKSPPGKRLELRNNDTSTSTEKLMTYWTDSAMEPFTEPLLSFKCFLAILLFLELDYVVAPQQSVLSAAEIVMHKRKYPSHMPYVYPWAELFMPGLKGDNVDDWVDRLQQLRTLLILCWFSFLLVPKKYAYVGGGFYSVGAILYVYLGVIVLMYSSAHCTQAAMLFIFSAIPAVPFLESDRRVNHWLRKFLYICVLNPVYLFAGICKIRYKGIRSNLTGKWMRRVFKDQDVCRVVLKRAFKYISKHPRIPAFLMSWGNIVTELVLPTWIMLRTDIWKLQFLYHFAEIMFHVTIFFLIGPNFIRYCLLHVFASNPLGYVKRWRKRRLSLGDKEKDVWRPGETARAKRGGYWILVSWALFILFGWWSVQFNSDYLHLTGSAPPRKRVDPYFPWPELSMFATPKDSNMNFYAGLALTITTACVQIFSMTT